MVGGGGDQIAILWHAAPATLHVNKLKIEISKLQINHFPCAQLLTRQKYNVVITYYFKTEFGKNSIQ